MSLSKSRFLNFGMVGRQKGPPVLTEAYCLLGVAIQCPLSVARRSRISSLRVIIFDNS
jgi:hypothetical protein